MRFIGRWRDSRFWISEWTSGLNFEDWQCQSGSISRPLNRTAFRSIWIFQVGSSNHRVRTALVVVPYYSSSVTELRLLESQVRRRICVGAKRKVRANWVRRLNITWKRVKLSEQCSAFNLLQTTALLESLVRRTTETVAGSLRRTHREHFPIGELHSLSLKIPS